MLTNLIGNAIKFTPNGSVQVEVNLKRKRGNSLWVDFSVEDTGQGIPEEEHESIFEAFTQVDTSTARPYEGTGLGLAITKLVLKHMKSDIHVESSVGKGSRFYFTLPMKVGQKEINSIRALNNGDMGNRHLHILVVEDMETNRKIVKQFLNHWWDLSVDEATDGKEAIEKVKNKKYDLILMDIRMPEIDGYEATSRIRKLKNGKEIPILALTADTIQEMKKYPEASLFTDVIIKPFDPDDLKRKIIQHTCLTDRGNSENEEAQHPNLTESGSTLFTVHKLADFVENDKEMMVEYLETVMTNLPEMQQEFKEAVQDKNADQLSSLKHKKVLSFDILEMEHLKELMKRGTALLKNSPKKEELDLIIEDFNEHIDLLSQEIKNYINRIKSTIPS